MDYKRIHLKTCSESIRYLWFSGLRSRMTLYAREKKNTVILESQMPQDLTLICNAAYIKFFFSPAAKLPEDKMS